MPSERPDVTGMGKLTALAILCCLASGCATPITLSDGRPVEGPSNYSCLEIPAGLDLGDLENALATGDVASVKTLLAEKSFKRSSLSCFFGNTDSKAIYEIVKLNPALVHAPNSCKTVPILIRAGLPFDLIHVQVLTHAQCPEILVAQLKRIDKEGLEWLAIGFDDDFQGLANEAFLRQNGELKSLAYTAGFFQGVAQGICSKKGNDAFICKVKKRLSDDVKGLVAHEKAAKAFQKVTQEPEFRIQQICSTMKVIRQHLDEIEREREVGRVSGAVNLDSLHANGERIVELKRQLTDQLAEYKAQTGQSVDADKKCETSKAH